MIKNYFQYPFRPLYAWCDVITFKPYMILARGLKAFYLTFTEVTPIKVKSVSTNLNFRNTKTII
jgi:hypothetical protein